MKKPVTKGKIIGTIISALVLIVGIVIIAVNINADTAFPVIGGIFVTVIGISFILCIWFPNMGSVKTSSSFDEDKSARKAQKKAERDAFITVALIDDALNDRKSSKKENVWEDNSEDNDDADPDNW